jgi:HEAT repeat protein
MTRDLNKVLHHLGDEEKPISYQLLRNLSELSEPELVQLQRAWRGYSASRRRDLIQALVTMAEEHSEFNYNAIFAWAMDDPDARVRVLAIEGLWEDQNMAHLPRFMHMLVHDEDVDVRAAAAMAVGRYIYWAETNEIPRHRMQEAIDALWDVYHDPVEHVHVRRRALEGLGGSSHPGAARLIERAQYDEDPFMQSSALYAMGRSADVRWIPHLLPHLESEIPELRMEAARALGELEAKKAVDPMIRMLDTEPDMEVRFAILEALGQIGGDKAKQALELAADSDDEAEAEAAEAALEQLYAGINNLYELIDEVLGLEEDVDAYDPWDDTFFEDPLEAELRQLLDDEDLY